MCLALSVACTTRAGIEYRPDERVVWVRDFPRQRAATLDDVLQESEAQGWDVLTHDVGTDTYRLDASLWVGDSVGLGTCFRIGDARHPHPTVIVRGDVWVQPPRESPARRDGMPMVINRLTLGSLDDPVSGVTLKFDGSRAEQYGLFVGVDRRRDKLDHGGALHIFNSRIGPLIEDRAHRVAGGTVKARGWYGSDVKLINTTVTWLGNRGLYGVHGGNTVIQGCTFTHCEAVFKGGRHSVRDCVFRDNGSVFSRCSSAEAVRCRFERNQHNWILAGYSCRAVRLVDCRAGGQKQPLRIRKNTMDPARASRIGVPLYPACQALSSVVVCVRDADGRPVQGCLVDVRDDRDGEGVQAGVAVTGRDGHTPVDVDNGALLVTLRRLIATDEPDAPEVDTYRYRVAAAAPGFARAVTHLDTRQAIPRPVQMRLTEAPP